MIEVDYLVVGAGAAGMGFVDVLIENQDVEVLMIDRRHRPGGHWLDAYPFVRLHNPSALYGVASRRLGEDRIDAAGPNAGFYERAGAAAVCDYFGRVLDEQMEPSGKVRFWGSHEYRGENADGHRLVSLVSGEEVVVKVRRRLVDATYVGSEIPSRHRPAYEIAPGARVIPPNKLVDLDSAPGGFTVIGAGKTAMDSCCWLLDAGVDPDRVRWIRPRDPWIFHRSQVQPLELVASFMSMQARWVEACAEADDGADFAHRLEAHGVLTRIDPAVEPEVWRGAILSELELVALRRIERVERGRVRAVGTSRISFDGRDLDAAPDEIFVDCTAEGLPNPPAKPVFDGDRITVQHVTVGNAPFSAATLGKVETLPADDAEKNRLCPPLGYQGSVSGLLDFALLGLAGSASRLAVKELRVWNDSCRLNGAAGVRAKRDDPAVAEAFAVLGASMGKALTRAFAG